MTKKVKTKNRILNYTAVIVGIILCVSLGIVVTHADSLDKVVLLEDRNPTLYSLMLGNVYRCDKLDSRNLLQIDSWPSNFRGITFSINSDGSITLNGKNEGDAFAWQISYRDYLEDGQYHLSDVGFPSDDCYVYFEASTDGAKDVTSLLSGNDIITIDSNKYKGYWLGVLVKSGAEFNGQTIYPMISKKSIEFEPAWVKDGTGKFGRYVVSINEGEFLSDGDKKKLEKLVKIQKNCTDAKIIYTDNDGIEESTLISF